MDSIISYILILNGGKDSGPVILLGDAWPSDFEDAEYLWYSYKQNQWAKEITKWRMK